MKVAFVVEPHFANLHIGVRNYILALGSLLEEVCELDYIIYRNQTTGQPRWTRLWIQNKSQRAQGAISNDIIFSGKPSQVFTEFLDFRDSTQTQPEQVQLSYSDLGSQFDFQSYDAVLITNPWLVDFPERLNTKRLLGLVFDVVPNLYVFTRGVKPFGFANQHRLGFEYFRDRCDHTLAISQKTATDMQTYFRLREDQITALPPMIPAAYNQYKYQNQEQKYQLILASPFDPRKGIARMPTLIKGVGNKIRSVAIYGNIRCDDATLSAFFRELPSSVQVTWYLQATARSVQNLFEQSQVLLFPSSEEGLGLPVIEAQLCGTRVLASDIDPLNKLLLNGNALLTGDNTNDSATLGRMIDQPLVSPAELARMASERYSAQVAAKSVLPHFGIRPS